MIDYPDIFSNGSLAAERLRYAKLYIVQQHCQQRRKQGYARKRLELSDKENEEKVVRSQDEILDLTVSESYSGITV